KGRADKTYYVRRKMELRNDERHCDAERKKNKTVEQRSAGREHPQPALCVVQRRLIQQQREPLRWREVIECRHPPTTKIRCGVPCHFARCDLPLSTASW